MMASVLVNGSTLEMTVSDSSQIPTAAHLSPTWLSAYDISPLDSLRAKCQLLDEAARDRLTIVFYHDAFHPYATILKTRNSYTIAQPEPGAEAAPITIIN